MAQRPLVIVHGYSDKGDSADAWCAALKKLGRKASDLHVGDYVSLSNEITIKDIAEGFDRALRIQVGLGATEPFDAIVHSTGMLVVRAWLAVYGRSSRLKHLIGLAPATFGSPMAHKGRSFLGGIFKGNRDRGPDFMEAGDLVLSGLELGSRYTWDLAHADFLANPSRFTAEPENPYAFIFIGLKDYGFLKRAVTEDGTDGTVRWAGAGFKCRKVTVDLTQDPTKDEGRDRVRIGPWACSDVPLVLLPEYNHSTIFREPTAGIVEAVNRALAVTSAGEYRAWREQFADGPNARALDTAKPERWQQWVTHLVDERGDPIHDYYIELYEERDGRQVEIDDFEFDVHAFKDDESLRCVHVDLDKLRPETRTRLWMRLIASSGSALVGYHGFGSERMTRTGDKKSEEGVWDAIIDLSEHLVRAGAAHPSDFFTPFTTTLVEMKMNREPMPLDTASPNRVFKFLAR